MSKTVVGLFSTYAKAQQVKQALVAQGYEAQHITVVANDDEELSGSSASSSSGSMSSGSMSTGSSNGSLSSGAAGIGEKVGSFFRNLTGGDDTAHQHYATGVNSGGALLAVTVNDPQAAEVANLLTQHGATEIEGEYASSSSSTMPTSSSSQFANTGAVASATGETTIPIIEEQLVVGKRQVERGGVRIYSHVTERPVDASVTLHEERVQVERRPVNRPATAADFAAGSGAAIELRATGEEAVVGKSSRVVEEVLVGKQSSERTEQVHDSVRKTEVEVEKIDAATTAATSTATPIKSGY